MKPIKKKCLSYKNSIFTLSVILGAIATLVLNFILSAQFSVQAQDSPNIQPNTSTVSCLQIDDRIAENHNIKNPEEEFDFEEAVFVDPPNPNEATPVNIGLYVIDISNVNAVENTYRLEGLIDLVWCDPRFRLNGQEKQNKIYLEEDAVEKIQRIWWPSITFTNEVGEYFRKNEELIILAGGTVEYKEKFSVELKSFFDLTKFPFDEQTLKVEIESFAWDENDIKLQVDEQKIGFNPSLNLPEWKIGDIETQITQTQEIRSEVPFSKFLMQIKLIRRPGFYLWKVIIPLIILVIISWSVFWMAEESLADRISFSLTGILTVVAYQFLISENLPNISYLTLMDAILSLSFVAIALTVAENIVVNWLNTGNLKFLAIKLDRTCQLAFPSIYVFLLFAITLSYLAD
ncbi:MAG: hypothetical protein AB4206_21075 [Xenococcaceae cyanobacterium]